MTYDFAVTSVISLDHVKLPDQEEHILAGSCGVYISMALANLGAKVLYSGAHGADFPLKLLDGLSHAALERVFVPLDGAAAALYLRYTPGGDIAHVQYHQNSGASFRAEQLPVRFWDARAFWLGTAPFELLAAVAQRAHEQGKPVCLTTQNEFANAAEKLDRLIPYLSALCTNTGELTRYGYGSLLATLRHLVALNPSLTILATRGARGAWLITPPTFYCIAAYPAPRTINAIGAGDTFAAAYVLRTQQGKSVEAALQWAAAAAALKLRNFGYQHMPTSQDIQAFFHVTAKPLPVEAADWEGEIASRWVAEEENHLRR